MRPCRYSRLLLCLCGLAVLGGCNQSVTRPEITAAASTGVSPAPAPVRAQFDIPAILDELAGPVSPYCPATERRGTRNPMAATLGMPVPLTDLGSPGFCVVQVSAEENESSPHGLVVKASMPAYLP